MTDKRQAAADEPVQKTPISLFEFYAIGIERLIVKAPWELERAVSAYHESFLTEQRCLGLAILLLLGEEHAPKTNGMPGFEDQTRASVNQAVFLRALKLYFQQKGLNASRADMVLERMQTYILDSRKANAEKQDPLEAMFETVAKRVPPKDEAQKDQYARRVEKIYEYVEGLVDRGLLARYEVTS